MKNLSKPKKTHNYYAYDNDGNLDLEATELALQDVVNKMAEEIPGIVSDLKEVASEIKKQNKTFHSAAVKVVKANPDVHFTSTLLVDFTMRELNVPTSNYNETKENLARFLKFSSAWEKTRGVNGGISQTE